MAMMISKFHKLIQSRLLWGGFLVVIIFSFIIWGVVWPSDIEEMDRIIGQFLEFSRVDGGETLAPLDLAALADELSALYARRGFPLTVRSSGWAA